MSSRLGRSTSDADSDSMRSSRVGLSDYTTQRLAELRARRAELDSDYNEYKSTATSSATGSTAAAAAATPKKDSPTSSSTSSADLLESYRSRRGLGSTTSPTHPTPSSAISNGIAAKPTASAAKPTASATKPDLSASASVSRSSSASASKPDSKVNGHQVNGSSSKLSSSGSSLSSAASFSKADYTSSSASAAAATRGSLDTVKASASSLGRSVSARVAPTSGFAESDDECVGFASLPEQVHRKAVKRGFDFTLMVVGETGLGKSTLISSLFLNPELYKDREIPSVIDRISKTVAVEKKYMEIEEKGVKLRLTIVDTPGFNDAMDAEQSWKPIEEYINSQFDQYLKDETGLNRKNIKDHRVHCCLYFVSPYGHGLRQIDVMFMKRLHDRVNIVPIIAKADTLTQTEVQQLKDKILEQVEQNRIRIYEFPDCDSDEDDDFKKQDADLKASIPFAVIGSNTVVEVQGRKVRGRLYPWGVVEVDNPQHCDFSKLRLMLISTHMQDLKDVTRDVHYENFRARHIKDQMTKNQRDRNTPQESDDFYKQKQDRQNGESKLKRDSSPNFESIIDQDQLLEAKDEEIRRMQEMIIKMQAQLKGKGPANGPVPAVVGLGNL